MKARDGRLPLTGEDAIRYLLGITRTTLHVAVVVACTALAGGCALGRSNVKSLRDPEASRIALDSAVDTTVTALNAVPSRCGPSPDHRVRGEEFQVYRVVGRIVRVKREHDHDIHIVLEDPDNPRARMVVESDDPDFRANAVSPYRNRLASARHALDELLKPSGGQEFPGVLGSVVQVTGVGFFDMNHLQVGRSRSCIELHPILAITVQ